MFPCKKGVREKEKEIPSSKGVYKVKKFDLKQENSMEIYLILARLLNIYSQNAITLAAAMSK
jgi:hypothetical protein